MSEGTFDERANAYIDGELSPAETAAFEAEMQRNPELADAVERVRTIEAGLADLFGGAVDAPDPLSPEFRAAHAPIKAQSDSESGGESGEDTDHEPLKFGGGSVSGTASGDGGRSSRWLPYAAAAGVLLAASAFWINSGGGSVFEVPSAGFIYRQASADFEPAVVCDTPEKFLAYTEKTLGEPITANFTLAANIGISLEGWDVLGGDYNPGESDDLPRLLYARSPDGTPIVVYFREKGHGEPDATPPEGSVAADVTVHTKTLGRVTAYEISPLADPVVLGLLGRE